MRRNGSGYSHRLLYSTMLCGIAGLSAQAWADPQGGTVTAGGANISQNGKITTIHQTTDRAIIRWDSFNIAHDETAQFIQPSSSSIALNRIRGNSPSQIDGKLTANGNIILINPNGIIFGKTSKVDVNSLIASTSDVNDNEFMTMAKPRFNVAGEANAKIIAKGSITVGQAGLVGLVAPQVQNQGSIIATLGTVKLASGDAFTLDMAGDGLTNVAVTGALGQQLVENSGEIIARGGVIELAAATARDVVDSLVINSGSLMADSFATRNGEIILSAGGGTVRNTGAIRAKGFNAGEQGGKIALKGRIIENSGTIDADGMVKGGNVTLAATQKITTDIGSFISASSAAGVGGNVSIDAPELALGGTVLATGATEGGRIDVTFADLYRDSAQAYFSVASSAGKGGAIRVEGGDNASLYSSGTYISNGATTGGMIDLLAGQDVLLLGALLNANGTNGGGQVRVGGDYLGTGNTRRARRVLFDGNTKIFADAIEDGKGGRVIIWSDEQTDFSGKIYARGANGGKGGFIETSSKKYLHILGGKVEAGKGGEWLLDPADITINTSATTATGSPNFVAAGTASIVQAADIVALLNAGTNVTITTSNDGFAGNGDITVSSAITATGGGSLTLSAYRNITVNSAITLNGGALTLISDNAGNNVGTVSVYAALTTAGGNITLAGGVGGAGYAHAGTGSVGVYFTGALSAGGGNIVIRGKGGTWNGGGSHGVYVRANVTTSGTGTITISGDAGTQGSGGSYGIYTQNPQNITSTGSGAITLNANHSGSTYAIFLDGGSGYVGDSGSNVYSGNITINASGAGFHGNSYTMGTTGTINWGTTTNVTNGHYKAGGDFVFVASTGDTNFGQITLTAGKVDITAVGNLYIYGITTAVGNSNNTVSLVAGKSITATFGITGYSVLINSDSAGTGDNGNIGLNSVTAGAGNITIGAGANALSAAGANSVGAGVYFTGLTSAGGNIRVSGRGGNTVFNNYGVSVGNANVTTTGTGTITIIGVGGGPLGTNSHGVYITMDGSRTFLTGSGAITIEGTAGSNTGAYGVYTSQFPYIGNTTTFTGDITIQGTGGNGVYFTGYMQSNGGNLSFGTSSRIEGAAALTTNNRSISISAAGRIQISSIVTTNGTISVESTGDFVSIGGVVTTTATGSSSAITIKAADYISIGSTLTGSSILLNSDTDENGVGYISASGVITAAGDITIGGGDDPLNDFAQNASGVGINLGGSAITSTAGGNITINGKGGTAAGGYNYGVSINGTVSTNASGNVTIRGTGGTAGTQYNYGVYFGGAGVQLATVGSTGTITVDGIAGTTGSNRYGIYFNQSSGSLGGTNTNYTGAIWVRATGLGYYSQGGNIRTTNNTITIHSDTTAFTGAVNLTTTNNAISFAGTANSAFGTITTTNADINLSVNGGYLSTYAVTTSNTNDITLTASDYVYVGGTATGRDLLVRSDSDNTGGGYAQITGAITMARHITIGGGADATVGYAKATTTQYGVTLSTVTSSGGNILINGQGGASAGGGNYGISLGGSMRTTGTGTITLNGTGGSAGNLNYGISISNSGVGFTGTASGALTLNGTGGSGTSNYGIFANSGVIGGSDANYTGAITINASGAGLSAAGTIRTTNNTIDFGTTTNIVANANINTTNYAITFNGSVGNTAIGAVTTTNAGVTLTNSAGSMTVGSISTTTTGSSSAVTVKAADYVSIGSTVGGSSVLVTANTDANTTGYVYIGGAITAAGDVTLGGGTDGLGQALGFNTNGTQNGVRTSTITSTGGNITVTGKGGTYTSGSNYGVYLAGAVTTGGTGTITISGEGGTGGNINQGIVLNGNLTSTSSGAMTLTGVAGGGSSNYGINAGSYTIGTTTTTFTGALTINADGLGFTSTGGVRTNNNTLSFGTTTNIVGNASIQTSNYAINYTNSTGSIQVNGITNSGAAINITSIGNLTFGTATNSGAAITLTATGGYVSGSGITNTTTSGSTVTVKATDYINISGTSVTGYSVLIAADTDLSGAGYVYLAAVTSGAGDITLGGGTDGLSAATGANASNTQYGVRVAAVTSSGGSIRINGKGGAYTSGNNHGVYNTSVMTTSGTGTITITGQGGTAGNSNYGMNGGGNIMSTGSGAITITGTAGSGTNNYGVFTTTVLGTNTTTYTGALTINADGLGFYTSSTVRTNNNTLSFGTTTNITGGGNIQTSNYAINYSNSAGSIAIGTVTNSAAAISLTSVANMTTAAVVTTSAPITLTASGGYYTNSGAITTSTTSGSTVTVKATDYINVAGTITGYSVLVAADTDLSGAGYVYLAAITGGAGDITLGGGTDGLSQATGANANNTQYGVRTGAVTSAGGAIRMNGKGGAYASGTNYGVNIAGAVNNSGTGTINITGVGGTAGNTNYGIMSNSAIGSTGSGAITLSGTYGSGTSNYGIYTTGAVGTSVSDYTGAITLTATGTGMYSSTWIRTNNNALNLSGVTNFTGTATLFTTNTAITYSNSVGNLQLNGAQTTNADITLTSVGNVSLGSSAPPVTTGVGKITITASGGNITATGTITTATNNASAGVFLRASDYINVSGTITGYAVLVAADTDQNNAGYVYVNAVTAGAGTVTLGGGANGTDYSTGSNASGTQYGVRVSGITASGNVSLKGKGGAYTSGTNYGVYIAGTVAPGTGLTIQGQGGTAGNSNTGVYIGGQVTTTSSGAWSITGIGGSGTTTYGIHNTSTVGGVNYSGDMTLIADSINNSASPVWRTSGNMNIKPYTAGAGIGVGTGAGTLVISDAFLGYLTWGTGKFLTIGDTVNTGAMEIKSNYTFTRPVQFVTASGYDITHSLQLKSSSADTGTGAAVVLASGDDYINSVGSTAFSLTGGGRWLIYSEKAADNTINSLSLPTEVQGKTFGAYAPGSVTETGNVMFYSDAPNLGIITIVANAQGIVYGQFIPTLTYSFSCDTGCSSSLLTGALTSAGGAAGAAPNAGTYAITVGNLAASGYTINYTGANLVVSKKDLTILASNKTMTYGAGNSYNGFTSTGLVGSETIGSVSYATNATTSAGGHWNQGSWTITPSAATGGTFTASNYNITYNTGTLTINRAALTVGGISGTSRAYDGTTAVVLTGTAALSGKASGDDVTLGGTGAGVYGDANAGNNKAITVSGYSVSGADSDNYTFAQPTAIVGNVTRAALAVTASDKTMNYGAGNTYNGFTVGAGLIGSETITGVTFGTNATTSTSGNWNNGSWNITASGATGTGGFNANNYNITYHNGALTVNKIALTATGVTATSRAYNGLNNATINSGSAVFSGKVTGDVVTLDTSGATATFNSVNAGTGIGVTASGFGIAGADAGNYTFTQPTGITGTITKAALTITAGSKTMTYGDGNTYNSYTNSALQNGETLGSVSLSTNATSSTSGNWNAGSWNITASGATGGTFNAANYDITYVAGALTVNKLALSVSGVTANNKTYDGTSAATLNTGGASLTGKVGSDVVNLASGTGTFNSVAVGNGIGVTASGFTISGADGANYTVSAPAGLTANITKANLVITGGNKTMTYGAGNTYNGFTTSGLAAGETIGSVSYGTNATTSTSGNWNAGSWNITVSGATGGTFDANNYNVSYANGALTVNKKSLSLTGIEAADKVYDGTTSVFLNAASAGFSGLVGSDVVNLSGSGSGQFASANAANSVNVVITGYGIAGTDSANYNFSQPTGVSAKISKAILTVQANDATRTTTAPNPTFTYTPSGFVGSDTTSALTGLLGTTAANNSPAGTYAITQGTLSAVNYFINFIGGTLTITSGTPDVPQQVIQPPAPPVIAPPVITTPPPPPVVIVTNPTPSAPANTNTNTGGTGGTGNTSNNSGGTSNNNGGGSSNNTSNNSSSNDNGSSSNNSGTNSGSSNNNSSNGGSSQSNNNSGGSNTNSGSSSNNNSSGNSDSQGNNSNTSDSSSNSSGNAKNNDGQNASNDNGADADGTGSSYCKTNAGKKDINCKTGNASIRTAD